MKNTYTLMQAPETIGGVKAVVLVNTKSGLGAKKYSKYTEIGYRAVGEIKSELTQAELVEGFAAVQKAYSAKLESRLAHIKAIAEGEKINESIS